MDKKTLIENLNSEKDFIDYFHGPLNDVESFIKELEYEQVRIVELQISQGIIQRPILAHDQWNHYGTDGTITYEIKVTDGSLNYNVTIGFYYPEKDQAGIPVDNEE